jgi:hypothetical protein
MEKLAGRRRFGVDSKKINRLRRHDGNRDAGGKTARDRPRNEFDEVAHARKPHGNKKSSGHHRSQDQAGVAVFLDNQQNDRNEGRRRTADLYAASTKAGNHQTGKNRREQPERRRRVRRRRVSGDAGNTKGESQRKSDEADGGARHDVR